MARHEIEPEKIVQSGAAHGFPGADAPKTATAMVCWFEPTRLRSVTVEQSLDREGGAHWMSTRATAPQL